MSCARPLFQVNLWGAFDHATDLNDRQVIEEEGGVQGFKEGCGGKMITQVVGAGENEEGGRRLRARRVGVVVEVEPIWRKEEKSKRLILAAVFRLLPSCLLFSLFALCLHPFFFLQGHMTERVKQLCVCAINRNPERRKATDRC